MPRISAVASSWRATHAVDTSPRNGDVVIVKHVEYEIGAVPGPPQVRCSTKEDAVEHARRFATREAVSIWYRDGETLALVEGRRSRHERLNARHE